MKMFGAVYLLQCSEDLGTDIYKIGMTNISNGSRVSSYGEKANIIKIRECNNPKEVEHNIIEVFNSCFNLARRKEYFEGIMKKLEQASLNGGTRIQLMKMCEPVLEELGVKEKYIKRLDDLRLTKGFSIIANAELKYFGLISANSRSGIIRRCLTRAKILQPTKPIVDKLGIIEQSPYCEVECMKIKKNKQTYVYHEYRLNWIGFSKILLSSSNSIYHEYFTIHDYIMTLTTSHC